MSFREIFLKTGWGFPGGLVVESPPANDGDVGLIPGSGRSYILWDNYGRTPQLLSQGSRALASTTETRAPESLCSTSSEATTIRSPHAFRQ